MDFKICFPEGATRAVTFSYDDGQIYDRRLVEMFNKYKVKSTFHLNSGKLGIKDGKDAFIEPNEVKDLYEGHEVSAHGVDHPYFAQIPKDEMIYQILEDKRNLERLCGYPVRGMSYPYGEFSDELVKTAGALGMEYSRTVEDTYGINIPHDFMRWHPSCHHNKTGKVIKEFMDQPHYRELMLFYIWGHSFEFERENNWDEMEDFLKNISGLENTWYATNIEIKDYITAYRNLKITVDRTAVYNGSSVPVWLRTENGLMVVEPGKINCII